MAQYTAENIRNIALAGHGSAGKTSLAEALLFKAGATDRLGKVLESNTVCDFDPEEIKRQVSVSLAIAPLTWKDTKINVLDTPGLFDFELGMYEAVQLSSPCPVNPAYPLVPRKLTAWQNWRKNPLCSA